MPFAQHSVSGFDDLKLLLLQFGNQLKANAFAGRPLPSHIVFVFFTDSKLPDGLNWCEESARVEPTVEMALERMLASQQLGGEGQNVHWVTCHVGARDYWYNPNNPFRRDKQLRLYQIPALLGMYQKGGDWAEESADLSQIYEKEEHFASVKSVEEAVLDFVHLATRFGDRT